MNNVYDEIKAERDRQDAQWGGPDHDDRHTMLDWPAYITKQLGRYVDAADRPLNVIHDPDSRVPPRTAQGRAQELRKRMLRIAALAVACIDTIDRFLAGVPSTHSGEVVGPQRCDDPHCRRCGVPRASDR